MQDQRLGELLVLNKLITNEQFEAAMELQRLNPGQFIGQILCQMGALKSKDLEAVLDQNNKRPRLGEILVSLDLISNENLTNSLKTSREEKIPLGRELVKRRLLDEEQLARAIARQHDMPYVSLAGIVFDLKLSSFVNASFAQRLGIVPTRCRDKRLTIAMAYPIRRDELAQLESWCKMPIVPVIAKESDIVVAQQKIFKITGGSEQTKLDLELTEDNEDGIVKSKYVDKVISANVDYLTKRIITTGILDGTSDIHLESNQNGMAVRYRLDGILQLMDLGDDEGEIRTNARQIVSRIKILCDMDIAERRRPQDGSFKMKVSREGKVRNVDFRVSTVPTQFGENVVIRILDKRCDILSLEGLGYPLDHVAKLYKALDKPTGIFLVTGPTGSGKSSALYALLSRINTPGVKTLTIEDPIEYTMDGITQIEVNEVIGNTFAHMLRSFLRQDPDNIMVGEIRDLETATISMRAALTGHTVLSTLHTNDATSAVSRLFDMGVDPSVISNTLRCVLAQRLVRRICTDCKVHYDPPLELMKEFGIPAGINLDFVKGKGCPSCRYTGFQGRLPIVELWIPTREELLLISRRPDNATLRNVVFSGHGQLTMLDDGFRRVQAGETTLEELLRVIPYEQIESVRSSIFFKDHSNSRDVTQTLEVKECTLVSSGDVGQIPSLTHQRY
jgi:type II secretory ATPase GspE/PulE/Tfp pilus assembly ATPase PilB-like protein